MKRVKLEYKLVYMSNIYFHICWLLAEIPASLHLLLYNGTSYGHEKLCIVASRYQSSGCGAYLASLESRVICQGKEI